MIGSRLARAAGVVLAMVCGAQSACAQGGDGVRVAQVAPHFTLLSNAAGNLLVYAGERGAVAVGVQSPALVTRAGGLFRGAGPVRYALATDADSAAAFGAGAWGAGTTTVAHEALYGRMARRKPGSGLPVMGFSEVVQLHLGAEDVHFIHDTIGYSDADVRVHFEGAGIIFLGDAFTSDGFPAVQVERGGSVGGMIATADFFVRSFGRAPDRVEPVVPGRGPAATLRDLAAYRDMLIAVRDRVAALQAAGRTQAQVVAARPAAAFEARWGHGPVSADQFVAMVYRSVAAERTKTR